MPTTVLLFVSYLSVASLLAFGNWRHGPFLLVLLAAVQDPLRKLTPDAPAWFQLGVPLLFAVTFLSFVLQNPSWWQRFQSLERPVAGAMLVFAAGLVIPVLVNFRYGAMGIRLSLMGIMFYGTALANLVFGFHFGLDGERCRRLFRFHVLVTAVMLLGVPLDYWERFPDWLALGTEAMNMRWIRTTDFGNVNLYAGFYRSPDVMGWHAITMSLLALLLAIGARRLRNGLLWLALSGWGMVGVFLCGRRKFLYMIPVFLLILIWYHRRQLGRWVPRLVLALGLVGGIFLLAIDKIGPYQQVSTYYFTTSGDTFARVQVHTGRSIMTSFRQSGIFGAGLGSAATGVQHVGGEWGVDRPRTWQEGGLDRLAVELGLIGLFCTFYLAWVLWRRMRLVARGHTDSQAGGFDFHKTLLALIVANGASFVVSGQVFGDPFVGFFFSFFLGIMLAGDAMRRLGAQPSRLRLASPVPWQQPGFLPAPVRRLPPTPTPSRSSAKL